VGGVFVRSLFSSYIGCNTRNRLW